MNRRLTRASLVLGGGLLVIGGCAQRSVGDDFADVQRTLAERQSQTIRWNRNSGEDQEAVRLVRDLLTRELNADAAVQIALLNHRSLQALYEDLGIAQADLVRAGLPRNPVFDASARFQRGGGVNLEFSLVANFLDLFFIPLRKELAGTALASAKLQVAAAVVDHAADTRRAFYHVQAVAQVLDLRRTVFQAVSASWDLAQRLHEAGNTTDLDLAIERGFFEEAKLDLAMAEGGLTGARENVTLLMGLWGTDIAWTLPARLPDLPAAESPLDAVEGRAIERNLRLAAAKAEITGAAARLGVAKPFGILADSDVGISAERDPEGTWGVGPALSIPLPLFNRGGAARDSAAASLRASQARFYAEAVAIRAHARMARNRVLATRAQATYLLGVLLPLRAEIVARTLEQYNGMQVSPFQLIAAKQQQIETGVRYVEALGDYWNARADLERLLDGGSPDGGAEVLSPRSGNAATSYRGDHP